MKTNTNSVSRLQNRTAQSSSQKTQLQRIDFKTRFANRRLPVEKVLDLLFHETPSLFELAQVVGKWVWIQFDGKQPPTVTSELAQLGFHWNRKRQVWQHPCGKPSLGSRQDPRQVYRSYFPADLQTAVSKGITLFLSARWTRF